MVIVMERNATEEQIEKAIAKLTEMGFDVHRSTGATHTVLGAVGIVKEDIDTRVLELLPGVREVLRISVPYKLVSRSFKPEDTIIRIKDVSIGGNEVVVMAGPCAVESRAGLAEIAGLVKEAGAKILRGGAFKPRTSPYSFQGLGEKGLKFLREAAERYGLLVVTEIMDQNQIELVSAYADILQVGARNMQNYTLLKALGKIAKPVLLKRGMAASVEELLMSAEYIVSGGNRGVILCERGIKTFESSTRHTMDVSAIPVVHKLSHLPIIADPSHGTGRRDKVAPMARAAIAAGADGLLIEVHNDPDQALSDGPQQLTLEAFKKLMHELKGIASILGRQI